MADALPLRANIDWLRKTAKQRLRDMRTRAPDAKLAQAQLDIARQYGFSSWRSLKTHLDRHENADATADASLSDEVIASFLRAVGDGRFEEVRAALTVEPALVNATGPHPYWGGRPQALHVSIETKRQDMFELLIAAGADINGTNDEYEHWSPLMLTSTGTNPPCVRS
jgi:hypothetical protein